MFPNQRILPELYDPRDQTEGDDDYELIDLEANSPSGKSKKKKKEKTAQDLVRNATQKFSEHRKMLQEQVIADVMEAALPDMNDFNLDDYVIGKASNRVPPNRCIRCLQFFGCLTVSIHQAVENGSFEQLEKALNKSVLLVEKEKLEKTYIDELNVSQLLPLLPPLCLSFFLEPHSISLLRTKVTPLSLKLFVFKISTWLDCSYLVKRTAILSMRRLA
jgi:hypothetical protein